MNYCYLFLCAGLPCKYVCESEFQVTHRVLQNLYLTLYSSTQCSTTPSEAPDKANNHPHIICFQDEEEDLCGQYFIAVEQMLIMESSSLVTAFFFLFCAHYIFNVQYHPKASEVMTFVQEKVLALPTMKYKRSPSVLSHISGIIRYLDM